MTKKTEITRFFTTNESLVQCKICGIYKKVINTQHLKLHGITLFDYRKLFPYTQCYSLETLRKQQYNAIQMQKNPSKKQKAHIEKSKKLFMQKSFHDKHSRQKREDKSIYLKEKYRHVPFDNPMKDPKSRKKVSDKAKVRFSDPKNWTGVCKQFSKK